MIPSRDIGFPLENELYRKPEESAEVIISLKDLGVKYTIGSQREDVKARFIDSILKRQVKKEAWALRELSLSCYDGEIIGIIGFNGAGKTTLCRVLAGLIKPDEGKSEVHGTISALLSLGTGFRQHLTGRENIFLNAMMLGFSRPYIESREEDIIEFSGLGSFIDQPLKCYSKGMKARLGFSIAATIEPEILILDEALSAGDINFAEKAGQKLNSLIKKSKLVLMVTHNMGLVERYCSRAVWLDKGTIRADGNPGEIVKLYKSSKTLTRKKQSEARLSRTSAQKGDVEIINAKNVGAKYFLQKHKSSPDAQKVSAGSSKYDFWALKNVSFKVNNGEVVGIIGPNGAGKTTLCRLLTHILKPDNGAIRIGGRITALLSFGTGFKIELSGKDNIYLNGLMLGLAQKEIDGLFPEIVDFSGLGKKNITRPVKHYSSGMKARLGFSIASAIKPDVFIIDEAISAGDIVFFEKATEKIQELMKEAKVTIVVSHNLNFVTQVCTRAILLDQGQIIFDGSPQKAVSLYKKRLS